MGNNLAKISFAPSYPDVVRKANKFPTSIGGRNLLQNFSPASKFFAPELENSIHTLFPNNYPGTEWAKRFMKRHNLRLKKGTSMQIDRKERTSDPFIIYSLYDVLEKELQNLQLHDKPGHIYNLDETSFPLHSSKTHTVGVVGEKTIRVTASSGRQNITVLATICADGTALPPCIVFKGKRLMQQWIGDPETTPKESIYCVSDNGWMTGNVFHEFFVKFVELTKDKRPLLLILDGHISHTALATLKLAREEQISIVLLPPHCTDVLQPLDKVCFAPLKNYYDQALTSYELTSREAVSRATFVQLLTTVWDKGMSKENILKSFSATGIFPIDRTKFDDTRLSRAKVEAYNRWIIAGKPEDEDGNPVVPEKDSIPGEPDSEEDLPDIPGTPSQDKDTDMTIMPSTSKPDGSCPLSGTSTPLPTLLNFSPCSTRMSDYTVPPKACQHSQSCCLHLHNLQELAEAIGKVVSTNKSLEQIISDRQRPNQAKKPGGRRVLGKGATVLTQDQVISSLEERENAQKEKEAKKRQREDERKQKIKKKQKGKNKATVKKRKKDDHDDSSSTVSDGSHYSVCSRGSSLDVSFDCSPIMSDIEDEATDETEVAKLNGTTDNDTAKSVTIDDDSVNKFYAVLYTEPPQKQYYWGKLMKVFSDDEDTPVKIVEMMFLHRLSCPPCPNK